MNAKRSVLDLLIGAVRQLNPRDGERQNVFAFIQSCYCGRVRDYDLDRAVASLSRLTEQEQHALITWMVLQDDVRVRR
jgi:hypothetical protein